MRPQPGRTAQLLHDVLAAADTLDDPAPVEKQLTALGLVAKRYFAAQTALEKAGDALAKQMGVAHTALARLRKAAASADAEDRTAIVAGLFETGKVVRKAETAKAKAAKKRKAGKAGGDAGRSGGGK